jgi:ABC-2 type transport system ATP-binding protein
MLKVDQLRKSYGSRAAVAGVSLQVAGGQILGLLGPNGAGKSTTIGMIAGLITADGGSATINSNSIANQQSYKRRIGLVPQDLALYEELSAMANLELFGSLYGLSGGVGRQRARAALDLVGLTDRARDKPSAFSGGMKRRLNIACALVHDPDVLLLDEPTAGVDPQSRNAIFTNLEQLKRNGKALIYTTHYMEEVERLADHIVIMDHGKVVAGGTLSELYRSLPATAALTIDCEGAFDPASLLNLAGVSGAQRNGDQIRIATNELGTATQSALGALLAAGCRVRALSSDRASLEDVFLNLTGRQLRDGQ